MNKQPRQPSNKQSIYHLVPAGYFDCQLKDQPYLPATYVEDGFIHCTADLQTLLEVANAFFSDLEDDLLVLELDPSRLRAPLKFEPPVPPAPHTAVDGNSFTPDSNQLFPHIYGPINRQAIVLTFALRRDALGRWQRPEQYEYSGP
jgi:uncharacterized protein (DUF952 family)